MSLRSIPFAFYRSGTSRGLFLAEADLPAAGAARDVAICSLMGSGHPQQLEGFGGGSGVTSKAAVVGVREDGDLAYSFAQCRVNEASVDHSHGDCGNMIAAVAPFALERQLISVSPASSRACIRIHSESTGAIYEAEVQTNPSGGVLYEGTFSVPGVPRPAAPVALTTVGVAGLQTGRLLPTGNAVDRLQLYPLGLEPYSAEAQGRREATSDDGQPENKSPMHLSATLIDFARGLVIVDSDELHELLSQVDSSQAQRVKRTLDEVPLLRPHLANATKQKMEADKHLCRLLEAARRAGSMRLGMGDCTGKDAPKIAIVAPAAPPPHDAALEVAAGDDDRPRKPQRGDAACSKATASQRLEQREEGSDTAPGGQMVASLAARYWVNPARCEAHPTVAMTAAQALGAACLVDGSIAARALLNGSSSGLRRNARTGLFSFEIVHATGKFPVEIGVGEPRAGTLAPDLLPHATRHAHKRTVRDDREAHRRGKSVCVT